jgi:DNA repair exonuclease SbcCD ATPase subunit
MPATQKRKLERRRRPATTQTIVERLDQMQDLLVEMRGALDFQLRVIKKLQLEIDLLNESKRRRSARELYAAQPPASDVAHEPSRRDGH